MLEFLRGIRGWAFVLKEPIRLSPGSVIAFDDYLSKPGHYYLYFDVSKARPGDELHLKIEIQPGPGEEPIEYLAHPFQAPSLWGLGLPPCQGFKARLDLKAGRPLGVAIYIWRER